MGLGARSAWALVALGMLLVMTMIKLAVDSGESGGSSVAKNTMHPEGSSTNLTVTTGSNPQLPASNSTDAVISKNGKDTTTKPPTTSVSTASKNRTSTTPKSTKSSTTPSPTPVSSVSKNGTTTPAIPVTPSHTTSTTLKPTTKKTSVSPTTSQTSTSTVTTAHNSSVTSVSSSVQTTAAINSKESKSSKFDTGSFVGGIVLTLAVLSIFYLGCRVYYARRGIQYRTIDEHDAII